MIKYVIALVLICPAAFAVSDYFPQTGTAPAVGDFITTPSDTFYCDPDGNNTTGDGSIGNPWIDLIGADGNCGPGDLIYFRGGAYPDYAYSHPVFSQNILTDDGTDANRIVITNYPGEIVTYDSTDTIFCITLDGDYQVLLGTMVGSEYGIQINGGASLHTTSYCQFSGIEFSSGTSNGGDLNPAMLRCDSPTGIVISHNWFHDSIAVSPVDRVSPIRLFIHTDTVIEYNLFERINRYPTGGCVYMKDETHNATVRYNTMIDSATGVAYGGQGDATNGLDCYGNLFYNVTHPFHFVNDLYDSGTIEIHDNVALAIPSGGSFFWYLNQDNQDWVVHGDYYNNVIDGLALGRNWPTQSGDDKNIPDLWDYNLYYDNADKNTPALWVLRSGYYDHAVTSADAVTYNAPSQRAYVADDYDGLGAGRYGGNIGGFTFDGPTTPPGGTITAPTNLQSSTAHQGQ